MEFAALAGVEFVDDVCCDAEALEGVEEEEESRKRKAARQPNSVKGVASGVPCCGAQSCREYFGCPDRMSTQQGTRRQDPSDDRDEVVAAGDPSLHSGWDET